MINIINILQIGDIMDAVLEVFKYQVEKSLRNNLIKIILFGSRARGDFQEWSDYDFAIIVDNKDTETENKIDNISCNLFYKYNKLIGSIVWDKKEWEIKQKYPIGINIVKDGITL